MVNDTSAQVIGTDEEKCSQNKQPYLSVCQFVSIASLMGFEKHPKACEEQCLECHETIEIFIVIDRHFRGEALAPQESDAPKHFQERFRMQAGTEGEKEEQTREDRKQYILDDLPIPQADAYESFKYRYILFQLSL